MYSTQIFLDTGKNLEEETKSMNRKLDTEGKDEQSKSAIKALKKKLGGKVNIEASPFEIQENFIRSKLNIPPHIWDSYSNEMRGKTMAIEIVKSRIESLEDFYREMESAKNG